MAKLWCCCRWTRFTNVLASLWGRLWNCMTRYSGWEMSPRNSQTPPRRTEPTIPLASGCLTAFFSPPNQTSSQAQSVNFLISHMTWTSTCIRNSWLVMPVLSSSQYSHVKNIVIASCLLGMFVLPWRILVHVLGRLILIFSCEGFTGRFSMCNPRLREFQKLAFYNGLDF